MPTTRRLVTSAAIATAAAATLSTVLVLAAKHFGTGPAGTPTHAPATRAQTPFPTTTVTPANRHRYTPPARSAPTLPTPPTPPVSDPNGLPAQKTNAADSLIDSLLSPK